MKNFFKKNLIFLIYLTYFCHIETFSGCSSCKNDNNNNNKQTDETIEQKIERLKNEHINILNNYSSTAKNTYEKISNKDFTQLINLCKTKWDESLKDENQFNKMCKYLESDHDEKKMTKRIIYTSIHKAYKKGIIKVYIVDKNKKKTHLKKKTIKDITELHEFVMAYTGDANKIKDNTSDVNEIKDNTLFFKSITDKLEFFIFNKQAYSKKLAWKEQIKPIDGSGLYYVVCNANSETISGTRINQDYKANANFTKDNANDVYILEISFTEENIE